MDINSVEFQQKLAELLEFAHTKKNVLDYNDVNHFYEGIELNEEAMNAIYNYLEEKDVDVLKEDGPMMSDMNDQEIEEMANLSDEALFADLRKIESLDRMDINADLDDFDEFDVMDDLADLDDNGSVPIDLTVPDGISIDDPVRMYLKEIGKVP